MNNNPWLLHVNQVREKNRTLSYKEALQIAAQTYTRTTPKRAPAPHVCRKCKQKKGTSPIHGGDMSDISHLKTGLDASYADNATAADMLKKQGYTLDHSLSGERAKVFVEDSTGKVHIAYRGTANKHDVATDAMAYLGIDGKRVSHSKKVMKEAEAKYGHAPVAIGHSLGGFLAENAGGKSDVHTYNKLATGRSTGNSKQTDVRTSNDVASAISAVIAPKKNKKITVASKSWNPLVSHSTKALSAKNIFGKKR